MSSLDNLRKAAKRWLKALRANDPQARERFRRAHPKAPAAPGLRDVQHALAREHGHASWTALKEAIAGREPAGPALEQYDSLAKDLVIAYDSGDPVALRRLSEQFGTWLKWDDLRARVRERLDAVPASERPAGDFALPHARLVVARSVGFHDWTELANGFAGAPPPRPAFAIDPKENRIKPRRPLVATDWDSLIDVMPERRIPALEAEGQMSDAVLERISSLSSSSGP